MPQLSFQNILISLTETGAIPDTYGTATKVPRFAVDRFGRISGVVEVDIVYPPATVNPPLSIIAGPGIVIENSQGAAPTVGLNSALVRAALTGSASLTWSVFPAHTCQERPMDFPGAVVGEAVAPHWPVDIPMGLIGNMRVTQNGITIPSNPAAEVIAKLTVRVCNVLAVPVTAPNGQTYSATVLKFW